MKTLLLLALLLSPLAHAQAVPASMSGEWFVQESAGGSDSAKTCEFTQKGSDLTGTCTAKATGSVPITGKVDGDKITWTMKFQTMVGPVTATYHGALKAENKITGIANAQEFKMEGEFSATRYKLVWSDDFNQDGKPDPTKWTYETGFVRNQELQWYQPDNARCENGLLIIEARRERRKNPNYVAGSDDWTKNREYAEYTSASLLTRGLASWKYGRFEMRARIDTRPGLWPEFWTLGTNREWPWGGEIDILESWGGLLNANFIWAGQTPGYSRSSSKRRPIASFGDPDWSNKFHIWRMEWDEEKIRISVDDELLNELDVAKAANGDGTNAFRQQQYILLNLAVGGVAGGDPSKTQFPARYEVDWVRVYQ